MKLRNLAASLPALAVLFCSAVAYAKSPREIADDLANKGRVGGPDTTLHALECYSKAKDNKCPSLAKLDQDTAKLDGDTIRLADRLDAMSKRLGVLASRLAIPGQVAKTLGAIEVQMVAAQKGAKLAEGVPQFAERAKKLDNSITPALANVRAAKAKADAVARRVEPARKAADKFSGYSAKAALGFRGFSTGVLKFEPDVTYCVQFAVLYHDQEPAESCVQGKADGISAKIDPVVLGMDEVMLALLTDYSVNAPALAGLEAFDAELNGLADLQKKAEALQKRLQPICDALKKLEDKMDAGFTVSIPYLVGHYDIKVSMATILKGSAAIESYIEKAVSDAVWKAAKLFGLGKIVDTLTSKANDAINAILGKMNFTPDLSLSLDPLNKIEAKLPALEAVFPGSFTVPQTLDLNKPDFGLPHVPAGLDLRNIGLGFKGVSTGCATGYTRHLTDLTLGCPR